MRSMLLACLGLVPGLVLAEGVTRSVEAVAGGCKVTLAWEFAGTVESDLVVEEKYATGWSVKDSTVPLASLDATWFSGSVARFAVKPDLLSSPGSITFTVAAPAGQTECAASGEWMIYLGGERKKGIVGVSGVQGLVALAGALSVAPAPSVPAAAASVETAVAISSFRIVDGGCELSYSLTGAGTLVVEGCERLDRDWSELKRQAASAGTGKVTLGKGEVGESCFMRMKLVTEGK